MSLKKPLIEHSLAAITAPVISPDDLYIGVISSASEIQVIRCPDHQRPAVFYYVAVTSKPAQKVLSQAEILRWSPTHSSIPSADPCSISTQVEGYASRVWLLVSDRQRLVTLCLDLGAPDMPSASCTILADYDLSGAYGSLSSAEFVFNHKYAIVIQAMGLQASILSLPRPERHDVANVKYADSRSLAISGNHRYLSLLNRVEGQDSILVFHLTDLDTVECNAFSPTTLDAQGMRWSPTGDPLLCVWDSASFGIKVSFFTAGGVQLLQMAVNSESLCGSTSLQLNFEGLGINTLDWFACNGTAILAIFNCSGQLFLRQHSASQKFHAPLLTINHDRIVDGASYPLWQESQDGNRFFTNHSTSFEPRTTKTSPRTDQIAMNANRNLVATKQSSQPWTLWLWTVSSAHTSRPPPPPPPPPVTVISFRERIKQLLWHPTDPETILILTHQKGEDACLYLWDASRQQIFFTRCSATTATAAGAAGAAGAADAGGVADWSIRWIGNGRVEDSTPLLLINSTRTYAVGTLHLEQDRLVFETVL